VTQYGNLSEQRLLKEQKPLTGNHNNKHVHRMMLVSDPFLRGACYYGSGGGTLGHLFFPIPPNFSHVLPPPLNNSCQSGLICEVQEKDPPEFSKRFFNPVVLKQNIQVSPEISRLESAARNMRINKCPRNRVRWKFVRTQCRWEEMDIIECSRSPKLHLYCGRANSLQRNRLCQWDFTRPHVVDGNH